MGVYTQKEMSIKFRHILLLFYKISIPIFAFLPALQNLKDASVVEVRSSFTRFPGLCQSCSGDLSGNLSRAQTNSSLKGPIPDCRAGGRAVPSHSFELYARSDMQCDVLGCHV
jgi:hypothetical protein